MLMMSLPREDTRHAIIGLQGKLSDTPLIAPNHSQQGKSLWRQRGSELLFLEYSRSQSEVFISQGRKFDA